MYHCKSDIVIFYRGSLEITLTVPLMLTIRRISVRKVIKKTIKILIILVYIHCAYIYFP